MKKYTAFGFGLKTLLCGAVMLLGVSAATAQTISATTYPFTKSSGVALESMTSGTTQLVAAGSDDGASALTNIGFDFWFVGTRYTTFAASANGYIRLGGTINGAGNAADYTNELASVNQAPVIAPYWDDLSVGANGQVRYKVVGTAPNRKLVVEWFNENVPRSVGANGAATFQLWLFETTGVIEFVYGSGMAANNANDGYSYGMASSATLFASVTSTATWTNSTCSYSTANDGNTRAIPSGSAVIFTPRTVNPPTAMSFNAIGSVVKWTPPATNTGVVGYAIYTSTDAGANYTFNSAVYGAAANAAYVSGLSAATAYTFRVNSISEGAMSTGLTGTKTLSSCYAAYTTPAATQYTYTVAPGVTSVEVTMSGGSGGNATAGGTGSGGGVVVCTLAVTPGNNLNVFVGGAGDNGVTGATTSGGVGVAAGGSGGSGSNSSGGGGGATSEIRIGGAAIANRALVAAGGGGGSLTILTGGRGGATGQDGQAVTNASRAGKGATTSAVGAGGTAGNGVNGSPGATNAAGGAGGAGGGIGGSNDNHGGGGGGAGYYGGGGGSSGGAGSAGSGGGGSNFITSTGTSGAMNFSNGTTGNGFVQIQILTAITVNSMTGGGTSCANPGVQVGLNTSQAGVVYQLKRGGVDVGAPVVSTGGALDFGFQTTPGTYTAVAYYAGFPSCTTAMSGTAVVNITSPTIRTVSATGNGTYCTGSSGSVISLDNSDPTASYTLGRTDGTVVQTLTGVGGVLNFAPVTTAGTYTVIASNVSLPACPVQMTGSIDVASIALPTIQTVSGGGSYCTGDAGAVISLGGSQSNVVYTLGRSGVVATTATGTGSTLNFASQSIDGTYTVSASYASPLPACPVQMSGSATVTSLPAPLFLGLTTSQTSCPANTVTYPYTSTLNGGNQYTLTWSPSGILSNVTTPTTLPGPSGIVVNVPGAASNKSFTGTLRIINSTTGCGLNYSITLDVNPGPSEITILPNTSSSICLGNALAVSATAVHPFDAILVSQNFDAGMTGQVGGTWTLNNEYGISTSFWQIWPSPGYTSSEIDPTPGDGSPFMQTAPDANFLDFTTSSVITPAFSTLNTATVTVAYNQSYQRNSGETAVLQYSLNGSTWLNVLNQAAAGSDLRETWDPAIPNVTVSLPAGAINKPTVYLRWFIDSDWGFAWAIDNVVVRGYGVPLTYTWSGIAGATGLSCTACSNPTITPTAIGNNVYSVTTTYGSCTVTSGISIFTTNSAPTAPTFTPATSTCNSITLNWLGGSGAQDFQLTVATDPGMSNVVFGPTLVGNVLTRTVTGLSGNTTYYYTLRGTNACFGFGPISATGNITTTPTPGITLGTTPLCATTTSVLTGSPAGGTWTSANPSIATVVAGPSTTSVISGLSKGSVLISYGVGGCYATATQNVTRAAFPPAFNVTPASAGLCAGGNQQLSVPVIPATGPTSASFNFAGPTITISQNGANDYSAVIAVSGIPDAANITDMQVRLHPLQHSYRADLGLSLTAPNGQTIGLCRGRGEDGNHFADVTFTSATGATPIASMGTGNNVTGVFNPELTTTSTGDPGTMYAVAATTTNWDDLTSIINGNWTFNIRDNYDGDGGSLAANGVTITFNYTTPAGNYTWSNASGLYFDAGTSAGYIAGTPANTVYASPLAGVTVFTATANYVGYNCPTTSVATVSVTPLPTLQTVTGTGTACSAVGQVVGLANSQTGVNYQLYRGATAVGSPVAGNTGNAIDFGAQTTAGTYTVLATNATGLGCPRVMTGTAVVTIVNNPTPQTMTGGGTACANVGVELGLSNSQTGVDYTLYRGSVSTGIVVAGNTGNPITFGFQTTAGTYTVSAANNTSPACPTDMPGSKVVTINPLPLVSGLSAAATSPCIGGASTVTLTSASLVNGTTYTVNYTLSGASGNNATANASMTFGAGTGTFTVIAGNLGNAGATTVSINSITETATTCAANVSGVSAGFTVKTVPGLITGSNTICFGAGTTTASLSNSAALGTWSSSNTTVATINTTSGAVSSTGQGVTTITYDNGCAPAATMSMTVNATPAATIGGANTLCFGAGASTTTVTNASTNGTWSSSDVGVATINTTTGEVTSTGQGITTISYDNGCGSAAAKSLTVNATPAATIGGANTLCFGAGASTTTATNTSANGTWSSSDAGVATINTATGAITSTGQGVTTISYDNGCGAAATKSLTVNATPAATIGGVNTLCFGAGASTTTVTNTSTNGTWSSSDVSVATINTTTGDVTSTGQGITTISYDNGCGTAATKSLTVNATPAATIGGANTLCFGAGASTTTATNTSANGTWSSSDVGVATINTTTGAITSTGQGVTTISYDNGCGAAATKSLTVNATPAAIVSAGTLCFGAGTGTTTATNASTNGTWSSSNVGVATINTTTGDVTSTGQGITTISYDNGCGGAATKSMTVNATPAAIAGNVQMCEGGASITLSNSATNGTWSSDNASVATIDMMSGVVTQGVQGTALISYDNGCGAAAVATATVNAAPVAIGGNMQLCAGGSIMTLTNTSTNGTWSGGATTVATINSETGVVTSNGQGTTTFMYSNGCGTAAMITATVNNAPAAITGNVPTCLFGGTATLANASTNGTWSSSDPAMASVDAMTGVVTTGSISGFPVITYDNGCGTAAQATFTVLAGPAIQTFTGGGGYCDGGTGVSIGLTLSETGVNYQLFQGSTPVSPIIPGTTGSPITFGTTYLGAGYYYAIATNAATGCASTLPGVTVHINPLPAVFTVTGGGSYCSSGGAGVAVGLDNSALGVDYELYNGTTLVATVSGTGGPISFGLQSAGLYTALAVNTATGCEMAMNGSATVDFYPSPAVHNVIGGGTYCLGGSGINVSLDGSDLGIDYQLIYGGFIPIGGAVEGTGIGLDMGDHFLPGDYTVVARDTTTGCTDTMAGDAQINFALPPTPYFVGGGGGFCAGDAGVNITLSGSQTDVSYQLMLAGAPVGSPVTGTGSALDFGLFTTPGNYTVVATNPSTGCTLNMLFSATVSVNPVVIPTVSLNTGVGTDNRVCYGNPITFTAVTTNGGTTPTYEWKINNITVPGTDNYTYVPTDGDIVWVRMTSSTACAIPSQAMDTMYVDVDTTAVPSVFLTVDPITSVPTGTTVTFTAHVTNGGPAPTFQWFKNGTLIAGANTSVYSTNSLVNRDSIMVMVTTSGGCGGVVTVNGVRVTVYGVGVADVPVKISDVRLVPNPNKGTFSITGSLSTPDDAEVDLDVVNMLGQSVYKGKVMAKNGQINEQIQLTNNLANGMYMLNLQSGGDHKVFHFVLEQ